MPLCIVAMNFCSCKNLLVPVVAESTAYFECSVCKMRHPFAEGHTLIKPPIVKPTGHAKVEHTLRHLWKKNTYQTCTDVKCPKCGYTQAKVLISDGTWYSCMGCGNTFT